LASQTQQDAADATAKHRDQVDTDRPAKATEEILKSLEKSPPEITIKFSR
jgi:hypothetical protein